MPKEKFLDMDSGEGFEGFVENSPEFLAEIKQLNEQWYVLAGLAFFFAVLAYFIHKNLREKAGIQADFRQPSSSQRHSKRQLSDPNFKQKIKSDEAEQPHSYCEDLEGDAQSA